MLTFLDNDVWFFYSSDYAIRVAPILGHTELCQSSKKAFPLLLNMVVVLLYKGMAQMISISHPREMRATAENEILAENVAKMDSLQLASLGDELLRMLRMRDKQ